MKTRLLLLLLLTLSSQCIVHTASLSYLTRQPQQLGQQLYRLLPQFSTNSTNASRSLRINLLKSPVLSSINPATLKSTSLFQRPIGTTQATLLQRYFSEDTENALLLRIAHASRQDDEDTLRQTLAFIKEKKPDLLNKAQEVSKHPEAFIEEQHQKETAKQLEEEESSDQIIAFFKRESNPMSDLTQPNYGNNNSETINKLDLTIKQSFLERANKVTFTIQIDHNFPKQTWREFFTQKNAIYVQRIYDHVFTKTNMESIVPELSEQEKVELMNEIERTGVDVTFLANWDPVSFGGLENKERIDLLGRMLYLQAMVPAIEHDEEAVKYINNNISTIRPIIAGYWHMVQGRFDYQAPNTGNAVKDFVIMSRLPSAAMQIALIDAFQKLVHTYRKELIDLKNQADKAKSN